MKPHVRFINAENAFYDFWLVRVTLNGKLVYADTLRKACSDRAITFTDEDKRTACERLNNWLLKHQTETTT